MFSFFFFNDTATTEIYTLSLHDALPILFAKEILHQIGIAHDDPRDRRIRRLRDAERDDVGVVLIQQLHDVEDRKSTRLNSSHANISYAVFCLKKKKNKYLFIHLSTIVIH